MLTVVHEHIKIICTVKKVGLICTAYLSTFKNVIKVSIFKIKFRSFWNFSVILIDEKSFPQENILHHHLKLIFCRII
jgi:hypothetical protein